MKRMTSQMAKLRKLTFINPVLKAGPKARDEPDGRNVCPAIGRYKGGTLA
jgi:hypothetical protein